MLIRDQKRKLGLLGNHDLAYRLKISSSALNYLLRLGMIPKPTEALGKRMYWRKDQVEEIKEGFLHQKLDSSSEPSSQD